MERISAERIRMSEKAAQTIRMVTAPHFMAMLLTSILYAGLGKDAFVTPLHYIEAIFTLTVLPMLSYLVCRVVPSFKQRGRKLERNLAIVFSVIGYVMGTVFALTGNGTKLELILYLTYLISGVLTGLCSFVFKFKASGHTCGVSGPAALMSYSLGPMYLLSFAMLVPVFISSLKLERHSMSQLIAGAIVPIVAMLVTIFTVGSVF